MKRKLYNNFAIISTLAIFLTTLFLLLSFYNFYTLKEKQSIRNYGDALANYIESTNLESVEKLINSIDTESRITLINKDGTTLIDTNKNIDMEENRLNRPEIKQALKVGKGESIRYSTSLETNTYYYAILLPDNRILRISVEKSNVLAVFLTILPSVLLVVIILLLISFFISSWLTKKIIKPIEDITKNMDSLRIGNQFNSVSIYDELLPFVQTLAKQGEEINLYVKQLTEKINILEVIISNMDEGLILIDKNKYIILANQSGIKLLDGMKNKSYYQQHFITLCRHIELNTLIEESLNNGTSEELTIESNSKFINVFINPVFSDNTLIGAVLLFVDSTEKHKADLIRKEFSANVSHELKTPLTSINGYAEMIENGLVQGEDIKIFASIIKKEGDRLLKLIDSIIKLSKIENQVPNKDMDYVDLYSIAKVVSQRLNIFIKEKNLTFLLRGESTFVKANPTLIEELIYNLLDNSIKYTETCGIITIDIYQELSKAILKIKDSGVGIPIEHQDRIFERFYIVNKNRPHKTKSTGLGLSIVKHIVQYHNASIDLVSEPNKGTEIIIKFNL